MTTNSAPLRTGGIAAARDYAELPVWQKAIALAEQAFTLSKDFDSKELRRELCAAATRIATHIAAGSGKPNEQGILNSYFDAQAASAELDTLITLAERLGELKEEHAQPLQEERAAVTRLLVGMRHGLKVEAKDEKRKEREVQTRDREHAERKERFDRKPKRDYGDRAPRERSDRDTGREERQYKPRGDKPYGERKPRGEGEYKPKRDFGDRKPRGDGDREYKPRRDFGDKPRGERKPYGDKPRGDRKPYGDKKPFKKDFRKD